MSPTAPTIASVNCYDLLAPPPSPPVTPLVNSQPNHQYPMAPPLRDNTPTAVPLHDTSMNSSLDNAMDTDSESGRTGMTPSNDLSLPGQPASIPLHGAAPPTDLPNE